MDAISGTGGPLLMLFFETLEKQPCKQRSDLVLNGQMRVPKKIVLFRNPCCRGLPVCSCHAQLKCIGAYPTTQPLEMLEVSRGRHHD